MIQRRLRASLVTLLVVGLTAPLSAADDLAETLYTLTLASERELRAPGAHPTLDDLRTAIASYETIAKRHPDSEFSDHALWQGAGLAIEAFDLYRQPEDFEVGGRLLRALKRNHRRSAFARRVSERLAQLDGLTTIAWLGNIRHEQLPRGSRVVVSIDREVGFTSESLANPTRLFFDFQGTEAAIPLRNTTLPIEDDPTITQIRLGQHPNDVTRVVLDLRNNVSVDCRSFTLYDPFRLVIDCLSERTEPRPVQRLFTEPYLVPLQKLGTSTDLSPLIPVMPKDEAVAWHGHHPIQSAAPPLVPSENSNGVFSIARQLGLGVSRVVIDPGHGGRDPGARRDGLSEANLVLDIARRLQQRLAETLPKLDVILTRQDDVYLSLEERTTLANRVNADLFLSIHANASANHDIRGVETFFLNLATDPALAALAARENITSGATMRHLETLVETIATNSKIEESRDFAQAVQDAMVHRLRPIDRELPDLGVKQAPFVVLIGARMPSALSEIAFLTNERDAELLASDDYRDEIANGLLEGIVRYQHSLGEPQRLAIATADF